MPEGGRQRPARRMTRPWPIRACGERRGDQRPAASRGELGGAQQRDELAGYRSSGSRSTRRRRTGPCVRSRFRRSVELRLGPGYRYGCPWNARNRAALRPPRAPSPPDRRRPRGSARPRGRVEHAKNPSASASAMSAGVRGPPRRACAARSRTRRCRTGRPRAADRFRGRARRSDGARFVTPPMSTTPTPSEARSIGRAAGSASTGSAVALALDEHDHAIGRRSDVAHGLTISPDRGQQRRGVLALPALAPATRADRPAGRDRKE